MLSSMLDALRDSVISPVTKHPVRTFGVLQLPFAFVWYFLYLEVQLNNASSVTQILLAVDGLVWLLCGLGFSKAQYDVIAKKAGENMSKVFIFISIFITAAMLLVVANTGEIWVQWAPLIASLVMLLARPLVVESKNADGLPV